MAARDVLKLRENRYLKPSVDWLEENKKGFFCDGCGCIYFYWNEDKICDDCYQLLRHGQ